MSPGGRLAPRFRADCPTGEPGPPLPGGGCLTTATAQRYVTRWQRLKVEVLTEIEREFPSLVQQSFGRTIPDVEITDNVEHVAIEQFERRVDRQSRSVGEECERRMIRADRTVDRCIAFCRIVHVNLIGVKAGEDQSWQ